MVKVICFDLWGDLAHFKKNYTTTSPLSHSVPPRSTLAGIIAAILGISKNEYPDVLDPSKTLMSVRLMKPIKRIQITENLVWTKEGGFFPYVLKISGSSKNVKVSLIPSSTKTPHIQVRIDFIKDPMYRVYFYHENEELFQRLEFLLKEHKSIYTPYLGISELLANFEYVDTIDAEKIEDNSKPVKISSIVPLDAIDRIEINPENNEIEPINIPKIMIESLPLHINANREGEIYGKIVFENEGNVLTISPKTHYWKLSTGENVLFYEDGIYNEGTVLASE